MTISLNCPCGKTLKVRDDQAGQRVRCPHCKQGLTIPPLPADEDSTPMNLEQTLTCPKCKKDWPTSAVICINCGHNFQTGKALRTKVKVKDRWVDVGTTWLGSYTRLSINRDDRGKKILNKASWFLWLPIGSSKLDLTGYETVSIDVDLGHHGNALQDGHPDVYYVNLEGTRRKPISVYVGGNEWKMREVTELFQEAAGLRIDRK